MSTSESGAFEHNEGSYLQAPSPKRVRFDPPNGEPPEVMQVSQVVETVPTEDPNEVDTVTITVPSSQFEIEINSQVEEEEGDEASQIQRSDLTGPSFGIVQDTQVSFANSSLCFRSLCVRYSLPLALCSIGTAIYRDIFSR